MSIDDILAKFNAQEFVPSAPRTLVPKGWYSVVIAATRTKENNARTGSYLELELEIIEGEYKKRRIWDRLNLDNPNQTAVEIAKASLSAICHAVNVLTPQTAEEFCDRPLMALVDIQPAKGQYGESNIVRGYKPVEAPKPAPKRTPLVDLSQPSDDLPF